MLRHSSEDKGHIVLAKISLFGAVGIINTAVDWGVFWLLGTLWTKGYGFIWFAKALSYSCGVCMSFFLNSHLTFAQERATLLELQKKSTMWMFSRFVMVALLCLVVNSTLYMGVKGTAYWDGFALLVATLGSFSLGFILNHRWTYAVHEPQALTS